MPYVIMGTCHGRVHVMLKDETWSARLADESSWLQFDAATEARRRMHADQGYADSYALDTYARASLEKQAKEDHGEIARHAGSVTSQQRARARARD